MKHLFKISDEDFCNLSYEEKKAASVQAAGMCCFLGLWLYWSNPGGLEMWALWSLVAVTWIGWDIETNNDITSEVQREKQ
ncbi:MAG: hypothetical protein AAF564_17760 [Bacteroidota bacterium]